MNGAAAKHKEFNNDAIGGVGAAGLQYFFAGNAFAAFQYAYDREIAITPQMRSTTDSDRMWFVLGKSFWKNRIEVSLFYTPPLHIASGKCKTNPDLTGFDKKQLVKQSIPQRQSNRRQRQIQSERRQAGAPRQHQRH